MSGERLLVINPGSTSTKFAIYSGEKAIHNQTVQHPQSDLRFFSRVLDQQKYRLYALGALIHEWDVDIDTIDAFVARGGPLRPLAAGTYEVNADMIMDIRQGKYYAEHPSLLGCLMIRKLAAVRQKPAYIVDPVCVDEMSDTARITGLKGIERRSLWHALNSRHVARLACDKAMLSYKESRLIVAHLGSGISISAHVNGRVIDVNNANDMGPFSPTRAGGLPATALVDLCFEEGATKDGILSRLTKTGGLQDLLGSSDLAEVEQRISNDDQQAKNVFQAMVYQIAKEIGAMAAATMGTERIILTGGMANSPRLTDAIREHVEWIALVDVFPGEMEMDALALGALRVMRNEEDVRLYESLKE